jgi:hypothetical protein
MLAVILDQITNFATSVGIAAALRNLAEAYALVVAPERSTVVANAEAKS